MQTLSAEVNSGTVSQGHGPAIVIVSGGLDSVTLLHLARSLFKDVRAVSVNYGQRHKRELQFAAINYRYLEVPHITLDLSGLSALLQGSALTTPEIDVPEGHYEAPTMAQTVVPNRNAIL